jgi:DNA-binding NarL/FixJ family response regulator
MVVQILVIDDHELVRLGIADLIRRQPGWDVCGEAADALTALRLARQHSPNLAIVDLRLQGGDGLELVKQLTACCPGLRILVSSMQDERLYAERTLRAGARGFISKQEPASQMIAAIKHVLAGKVYLSPVMTEFLLARTASGTSTGPIETEELLSDREIEVFRMLGEGRTVKEIARQLHLSPKTVEYHRQRIKEKLSLESSQQLLRHATIRGLKSG